MEVVKEDPNFSLQLSIFKGISHPNIVKILAVEITEDFLYIAMEKGQTDLQKLLKKCGDMPNETEIKRLLFMIAKALNHL